MDPSLNRSILVLEIPETFPRYDSVCELHLVLRQFVGVVGLVVVVGAVGERGLVLNDLLHQLGLGSVECLSGENEGTTVCLGEFELGFVAI